MRTLLSRGYVMPEQAEGDRMAVCSDGIPMRSLERYCVSSNLSI
jgi:hypothetical protein